MSSHLVTVFSVLTMTCELTFPAKFTFSIARNNNWNKETHWVISIISPPNSHCFSVRSTLFLQWQIFTFSKQSFNKPLDFCNRSWPHEWHKFDWQLPSSIARALGFEHQIHSPEVTLVLIDSETHLSRTCMQNKLLVCSIGCPCSHWLLGFSVLHSNKTVNTITY